MNCLRALGSRVILDGEETWLCFLCNKTRRGRTSSTSRILRVPSSGPSTGLSGNGNNVTSAKAVSGEVRVILLTSIIKAFLEYSTSLSSDLISFLCVFCVMENRSSWNRSKSLPLTICGKHKSLLLGWEPYLVFLHIRPCGVYPVFLWYASSWPFWLS